MGFGALLCVIIVLLRPWRTEDETWFRLSALLRAALAGTLLVSLLM